MRRAAVCLAAALSLSPLYAAGGETILLRGATVHTVSGPDIPNGFVLVRDGRIAEVGERIAASHGARIIDLKGLHIYPGMIDSATEIGLSEIGAVREMNDVSDLGLFKPQLRAATAVNPASEHIPVTRANGVTSVVTIPGGGIVAGQASYPPEWLDHGGHGGARAGSHAHGVSARPDSALGLLRRARPGDLCGSEKEIRGAVTRAE